MNAKSITKTAGVVLLALSLFLPVLTVSMSTSWVGNNRPSGAPEDFSAQFFSLGFTGYEMKNVTFNEGKNQFEVSEPSGEDEFTRAVSALQSVLLVLMVIALAFTALGTFVSGRREGKLGGFLSILGILSSIVAIALVSLLRSVMTGALVQMGGVQSGNDVLLDTTLSNTSYVWRATFSLEYGLGLYIAVLGVALHLLSLFISTPEK